MSNMDVWGATKTVLNNWIITLGSMGGGAKSNFFSMCNLSFISFFIPKRITEYKNTTFKLIVCPEPSGQVIVVNILYLWDQKTYSKCITYFCVRMSAQNCYKNAYLLIYMYSITQDGVIDSLMFLFKNYNKESRNLTQLLLSPF